jgi:protoporphyrinogen oxidase
MKTIAIVGAGVGGMAAAWDLRKAGHAVTIFEATDSVGGLAGGFKLPGWEWSVEKYYHHWFQTDHDILGLIDELGWKNQVIFPRPKTVVYADGKFAPLDSPLAALMFPGFNLFDIARFGFVTVYLRYLSGWRNLEKVTADEWMRKAYGRKLYELLFEPLLQGKFGDYYREVNMAWFWARLKTRTTRLGTFNGGFQAFADRFAERLVQMGVDIHLNQPVKQITAQGNKKVAIEVGEGRRIFDQVLVTSSPALLTIMAPGLESSYLKGLLDLKSLGAVVLSLAIKQPLSKEGYYWFNLPKSAGFPFLALVEHTNFIPAGHFGGNSIVYCGDYLQTDHEYFSLSKEDLLKRFLPGLQRINPDFNPDWVCESWLWKTNYAQPIPLLNHSRNIPSLQTPMPGLFFASMSQVYPWDRGTNYAVQVARRAARLMMDRD